MNTAIVVSGAGVACFVLAGVVLGYIIGAFFTAVNIHLPQCYIDLIAERLAEAMENNEEVSDICLTKKKSVEGGAIEDMCVQLSNPSGSVDDDDDIDMDDIVK